MNSIYVKDLPKNTPNLTGYTLYNDGTSTTLTTISDLKTTLGLSNTNSGDSALHDLLVPYTGSTQDVNLGTYGLNAGSLTVDLDSNRKTGLVNDGGNSILYSETFMNIYGSEGASINTGENGYIDLLIEGEDRLNIRNTVIIAQVPVIAAHGITGTTFKTPSGTTTQFLKADGSVDNNLYVTTPTFTGHTHSYLPLTGGTLSGSLTGTSFIKTNGTSSQFLKADGSVDSNIYFTTGSTPLSLKSKLIGSDDAVLVNGLTPPSSQEVTFIEFNGKYFLYYTSGWSSEHINVAEYDVDTNTANNSTIAVDSTLLGVDSSIVKCSYAFVYDSKIYIVVTAWFPNYCMMLSSTDGRTFTVISTDIVDEVSGFKSDMYGNHCIIPYRIDGYFYWFIEGRQEDSEGNRYWAIKLMKSTTMESGWELIGEVQNLNRFTRGGTKIFYDNGIFKMFYHYSFGTILPCVLGYAESNINNPLYFTKKYYPLLGITRDVFEYTDQIADPEIVEVDGKTLMFASYVDNRNALSSIYVWKSPYRIHDILNSSLHDLTITPRLISATTNEGGSIITLHFNQIMSTPESENFDDIFNVTTQNQQISTINTYLGENMEEIIIELEPNIKYLDVVNITILNGLVNNENVRFDGIEDFNVLNYVPEPTPPQLLDAYTNSVGTQVTLVFDKEMKLTGFTTTNGADLTIQDDIVGTLNYLGTVSKNGNDIIFDLTVLPIDISNIMASFYYSNVQIKSIDGGILEDFNFVVRNLIPSPPTDNNVIIENTLYKYDFGNPSSYVGSGSTMVDLSNHHINATLYGGYLYSTDGGGSMSLNGVNGYATAPSNEFTNITGNYSFSAWIKINSFDTDIVTLLCKYNNLTGGTTNGGYEIRFIRNYGYTQFGAVNNQNITAGGGGQISFPISFNEWQHVAVIYNGSNVSMYLNGILIGKVYNSVNAGSNNKLLNIGRFGSYDASLFDLGRYFNGKFASLEMLGISLNKTDILNIYNTEKSRFEL